MRKPVRNATLALLCGLAASAAYAQRGGPPEQERPQPALRFRYMGPASAGRIASVAGIPGNTATYYAGAASGGVWISAYMRRELVGAIATSTFPTGGLGRPLSSLFQVEPPSFD